MLLEEKVAIVSGVGPGTGLSVALSLAQQGANLVIGSRHAATYEPIAEKARGLGRRVVALDVDVTKGEDHARLIDAAMSEFGRIDILVNNAFSMGNMEPLTGSDIGGTWGEPMQVNCFGTVALSERVARAMIDTGGGSIVMIGTQAALKPVPTMAAYGASKAALMFSVRAMATEFGEHRIRVNCVVPSHIDGPNLRAYFEIEAQARGVSVDHIYGETAALGLLPHVCTSDEVAQAVLFFASSMSSAVTGQNLLVNCGQCFD